MSLKRFVLFASLITLAFAGTAHAKSFKVIGGGGQGHIGNGLMLPVQAAATAATTGTVFPNLKVPVAAGATVTGTTAKPLQVVGPKSGYQRTLSVPAGVLNKPAAQTTVGVKFSNPAVYAVGTNMNFTWPAAPAVFAQTVTGNELGATSVVGFGGSLKYSNTLSNRFGGAAQFSLTSGGPAGLLAAPVTVYLKIGAGTPACTHPAFGGTDATCVAGLIQAVAGGAALFGPGGATATTVMTPGGAIAPNVAAVKMGLTPLGTISAAAAVATAGIPTNKATSQPGPWTTGKVIIDNPAAGGSGEKFTLSGKDSRTAGGKGTIQLVSGALSTRTASGPNANRGWVELELGGGFAGDVPAMSPSLLAFAGGLVLLAGGYAVRRRNSA